MQQILSEHMRKHVVALVPRCLVYLEQATVRIATPITSHPTARRVDAVTHGIPASRAALSAYATAPENLPATIEHHVELGVADDAALTCGGAQHNLDVLAFDLKQLRGHFPDSLSCLSSLAPTDRRLEFAWLMKKITFFSKRKRTCAQERE
ncbi:hypothetical protein BJV74DRAFT_889894 [Russula compacta]|nr:hypothetical protein BJV74DRAFT_889894 [Russula compacta]